MPAAISSRITAPTTIRAGGTLDLPVDLASPVDPEELREHVRDVRRVEATVQEKMGAVTAGLPLPPGFKMPF